MTDDPQDITRVDPRETPEVGAGGRTDVLGKTLDYIRRLNRAGQTLGKELDQLGDEYIVERGHCRVEHWQLDAIVIGPPGIFLIWATWGDPEAVLWFHAEACRRHVLASLGEEFRGSVEIVFYTNGSGPTRTRRCLAPPAAGSRGFNVLLMQGQFAQLLRQHQPPAGLRRLSGEWLDQLRRDSVPDFWHSGPHPLAQQVLIPRPRD
jgi:hypothetical protein